MDLELKQVCDLFVQNRKDLKTVYKYDYDQIVSTVAILLGQGQKKIDIEKVKKCDAILKSETGIFSKYRGNIKISLVGKMAMSEDPKTYFEKVKKAFDALGSFKWTNSDYKILAAITFCEHGDEAEFPALAQKTDELYKRMKKEHPYITSDDDVPFAALLATSKMDVDRLIEEMETIFKLAKPTFKDSNAVQALSHVLAMNEEPADSKCEKVIRIFDLLKEEKHKFPIGYYLATLGTIALIDMTAEEIARSIVDAEDYLKKQKGFGSLSMSSSERKLYAAQMVLSAYGPNMDVTKADSVMVSGVIAAVIAMEVCLMICMTTTVAATTTN